MGSNLATPILFIQLAEIWSEKLSVRLGARPEVIHPCPLSRGNIPPILGFPVSIYTGIQEWDFDTKNAVFKTLQKRAGNPEKIW